MIVKNIRQQIAEALKAKSEVRLSTLRLLSSAINYEKIAKRHDLNEDEEIIVIKREIKKRTEAIEIYEKHGVTDRVEKEKKELQVLKEFLPNEMDDDELIKIVDETIVSMGNVTQKELGRVIGEVVKKVKGRADGKRISELVKTKLT